MANHDNEKLVQRLDSSDAAADRRGRKNKVVKLVKQIMEDPQTSADQMTALLVKGTHLHKVRSHDKFHCRQYFVDTDTMRLYYEPSIKQYLCREVPYIDLCDLAEVRPGMESDRFNEIQSLIRQNPELRIGPKNMPTITEDKCFSLVFNDGTKTEDLVAVNTHVRELWVRGIAHLIGTCKIHQCEREYHRWVVQQFDNCHKNRNGNVEFDELMQLLTRINFSMDEKHAKVLYDQVKPSRSKMSLTPAQDTGLSQDEFLKFYDMIDRRPELDALFHKYSINKTQIMGAEELMQFFKIEQKMTKITISDCEEYINRFEPKESDFPGYMSLKGFRNLFTCVDFDVFNKSHRIVCQDMSQPLTHYFIASSHNTYLVYHQLHGDSSIEAYRRALMRGCRCVELDVWDGDDGEPIIYHGRTLTSKIHLRDVLKTIAKYAFRKSEYPVILSMENHCSVGQQVVMAQLMREILGDYLYTTPVDKSETKWPSPESLKEKILIKNKKLPSLRRKIRDTRQFEPEDEQGDIQRQLSTCSLSAGEDTQSDEEYDSEGSVSSDDTEGSDESDIDPDSESEADIAVKCNGIDPKDMSDHNRQSLGSCHSNAIRKRKPKDKNKLKLARQFSDLVNYCQAKKFVSFEDCLQNWKFYEMVSFSEKRSNKLRKKYANDYESFTKKYLARIYPKASRTDSSNYCPIGHWNSGAQLVALNYQTDDKPMLFNEALFALNGGSGYVLKAEYLRKGLQSYANSAVPKRVVITIISGQQLPKPEHSSDGKVIDPYVKLKVYGHPADAHQFRTEPVIANGFNPQWDQKFEFVVSFPEMAFLYFAVKDQSTSGKNSLLAQYMLSFRAVTEGYRHIRLVDQHNQPLIPASLFVNVSFEDNE